VSPIRRGFSSQNELILFPHGNGSPSESDLLRPATFVLWPDQLCRIGTKIAALPDEQSRGAAFEVFAEAYLATQRKYDAAQVWPHGSVPLDILKNLGLTQQDQGVDGVLQTLLGQPSSSRFAFTLFEF
jgi:hypothetical protein